MFGANIITRKNDTLQDTIDNILNTVYGASLTAPTWLSSVMSIATKGTVSEASSEQAENFAKVNRIFQKLHPNVNMPSFAEDLYKAHHRLVSSCITQDEKQVQEAIQQIATLPMSGDSIKCILQSTVCHPEHKGEMITSSPLGYVTKKNKPEMVALLLQQGVDPYDSSTYDTEPYFFKVLTRPGGWKSDAYVGIQGIIAAYLNSGFDITFKYKNKNILLHALKQVPVSYHFIHLFEYQVVKLLSQGKIPKTLFLQFCEELIEGNILLIDVLPRLADAYESLVSPGKTLYFNSKHQEYIQLRGLLSRLISFGQYELQRVSQSSPALNYLSPDKRIGMEEVVKELEQLDNDGRHYGDVGEYANALIALRFGMRFPVRIFQKYAEEKRTLNLMGVAPTSKEEWALFMRENPEIATILDREVEEKSQNNTLKNTK